MTSMPRQHGDEGLADAGGVDRRLRWAIAAAVLVVVAAVAILVSFGVWVAGGPAAVEPTYVPTGRLMATVSEARGVRWGGASGGRQVETGAPVSDRPTSFEAGWVRMKLNSGVSVTLEGPVEFTLRSERRVELRSGAAVANVPAGGEGFTVTAPGMAVTVTGAGAEFGVRAEASGVTRALVFAGEVDATMTDSRGRAGKTRRVAAGHGVSLDSAGAGGAGELRELRPGEAVFGAGYALSADPPRVRAMLDAGPIVYWPLNDPPDAMAAVDRGGGGLHGQVYGGVALGAAGPSGDGAGGGGVAAFDGGGYIDAGQSERLGRLAGSFTVVCDAWLEPTAEIERLVSVDSRVSGKRGGWGVGVKVDKDTGVVIPRFTLYSVWDYDFVDTPLPRGRWVHLAVVVDARLAATLYVDGVKRQTIGGRAPAITGVFPVQIGQMAEGSERLHGRLAHVAVFDRLLSDRQIEQLIGRGDGPRPGESP